MQTITRHELYRLVWSAPTRFVAKQLGVSDVYVGHVCTALDVPKPARGWWAKRHVGIAVTQPPLPPPRPGYPTTWVRGQRTSIRPFREAARPAQRASDGIHPLVRISGRLVSFGPPYPRGTCLVPRRTRSIDLTVTADTFAAALRIANSLYLEIEARGHRVSVIAGRRVLRPPVEVWEHPPVRLKINEFQVPKPRWPTVATLGDIAIGLAIVETHLEQEMQYVGYGQYLPVRKPQRGKTTQVAGITWVEWQMRPQGRLRLIAYSAELSWRGEWQLEPKKAASQVGDIVDDLEKAAEMLRKRLVEEGSDAPSQGRHQHSTTQIASDVNGL